MSKLKKLEETLVEQNWICLTVHVSFFMSGKLCNCLFLLSTVTYITRYVEIYIYITKYTHRG